MSYLHHANKHISSSYGLSKNKRHSRLKFILLGLLCCIIVFFVFRGVLSSIIFSIRTWVSPNASPELILNSGAFSSQLQAYEVENRELKTLLHNAGIHIPGFQATEDTDINMIEVSASSTTESLEVTHVSTTSKKIKIHDGDVIAPVLVRPPQTPYDAIVIGAGENQGVLVGEIVYAFNGFPIGTVVSVEKNRSTIELYSAPGQKTEVLIGTSTTAALAEGKGGGNFALKLPKVTDIHVGDMVARQLVNIEVFSSIESVDTSDGEAYTYAYFKLPINLHSLAYVLVKKATY